jgi:hypothetical protein
MKIVTKNCSICREKDADEISSLCYFCQVEIKGYNSFKKYQVTDVNTVKEFVDRYYKPDRTKYCYQALIDSRIVDINEKGYTIISHHDSITGEVVSFYKK